MTEMNITLHLEADSADELSLLTIKMQIRMGMELHFFDFTQLKNGKFICWFRVPHRIWAEKVANGKA